ncbi:uncharacterized protein KY384_007974 [Bacidia gigantensis]|uniref:uncharacterized protein n=1 Tax=Bacidia gigantensis TaxID=2732470 RepID=UPI001D057BE1|nr:uncharacterized protein KY384_007974 [Bacidia gigantensis]KAG8527820.1 hypothetical protein KY384_007974 [Bacidia gigantensis]
MARLIDTPLYDFLNKMEEMQPQPDESYIPIQRFIQLLEATEKESRANNACQEWSVYSMGGCFKKQSGSRDYIAFEKGSETNGKFRDCQTSGKTIVPGDNSIYLVLGNGPIDKV